MPMTLVHHPAKIDSRLKKWGIDEAIGKKLLRVISKGLVNGLGDPKPGQMCVEAAVCYALGQPHGDEPKCVLPALRSLKIGINDNEYAWDSDKDRASGLKRLAIAQLGSKGAIRTPTLTKGLKEIANAHGWTFANHNIQTWTQFECAFDDAIFQLPEGPRRQKLVKDVCEEIVQLLVKLKSPGASLLHLTEKQK